MFVVVCNRVRKVAPYTIMFGERYEVLGCAGDDLRGGTRAGESRRPNLPCEQRLAEQFLLYLELELGSTEYPEADLCAADSSLRL
jgi:hypothetical protein